MNVTVLSGRLARDPELRRVGEKGIAMAFFTLAVDKEDGSGAAEFISCKVVGDRAESFAQYNKKGREIELRGRIQTWKEGEGADIRDRYIVRVDHYRSKAKPKSEAQAEPAAVEADGEEMTAPAEMTAEGPDREIYSANAELTEEELVREHESAYAEPPDDEPCGEFEAERRQESA
mgnify:FL=1